MKAILNTYVGDFALTAKSLTVEFDEELRSAKLGLEHAYLDSSGKIAAPGTVPVTITGKTVTAELPPVLFGRKPVFRLTADGTDYEITEENAERSIEGADRFEPHEEDGILKSFPGRLPVWILAPYIDHSRNRHAYILDACSGLWAQGRTDVRFAMFTSGELNKYGIAVQEGLTEKEIMEENHQCWIPALHNEKGVPDWLVSNIKED